MPDPEDQLRRLAAHRAEQVPAYVRATEPIAITHRRRPIVLVSIAAAVVIALVAAGFALWSTDDSRRVHVGTPTTTPAPTATPTPTTTLPVTTTTAPTPACPQDGASTESASAPGQTVEQTYIFGVNTQAGACLDAAVIKIAPVIPAWSVAYEDGPWVDTSSVPLDVPGAAHLVVRLAPGTLDSRYRSDPSATDRPGNPSVIEAVRVIELQDGGFAIVLGVPSRLPFRTVVGDNVSGDASGISVEFPSEQPRTECHNDEFGYMATIPEGWFVDTTSVEDRTYACAVFGPGRFTQYLDDNTHLVYVVDYGLGGTDPLPYQVVSEQAGTVEGVAATATEFEYTVRFGYQEAGELVYRWTFDGRPIVVTVPGGGPSALYDQLKVGADGIARSMRFD